MAHRRPRDRVDQLREEAGVPPSPGSVEVRHRTMMDMQMESLGTWRRESISSQDFPENRGPSVGRSTIEASRLSNRPGTQEFQSSREDQAELSAWNNAYKELEHDGTIEENLQDINHGQTHRMKLAIEQSIRRREAQGVRGDRPRGNHNPRGTDRARGTDRPRETDRPHETHHAHGADRARGTDRVRGSDHFLEFDSPRETNYPRGLDRSRGGARGGRGGGHAGGQNRGSRTSRVPGGYSPPLSSVQQESHELKVPPTSDEYRRKQIVPIPAASDAKRPIPPKWDQKLASPAAFMAAVNIGSPALLAPNQSALNAVAEARQDSLAAGLPITSKEVDQRVPSPSEKEVEHIGVGDSSSEAIDTLISTLIEFEPRDTRDLTQSSLKAEEKPLFSYGKDLIGLDFGIGASSSAAERDDGGKMYEDSETEDSVLPSETEKPLSDVIERLLQVVPAMGQPLRSDSIAQLEDIVARLKLKDSSLAVTQDTKKLVPSELPSTGQAVQVLPFSNVEKRNSTAASSHEITSLNQPKASHSESKGAGEGETFFRQSNLSWTARQKDVHSSPSRKGREEMIIGTYLMPGQSHQQGVNRSSGGTTPVEKLATVNHFGSTPSSSDALLPASLKLSLPGTLYQSEVPRSATGHFSATRRDSNWNQGDSYTPSTRTRLKNSGVNTALEKPYSTSPFVQHDAPAGGSMLNRTGFFRPENQSSMSMSQPAPASPVRSMTFGNIQVPRGQETPATYMAASQPSRSVGTAALSVMAEPAAEHASVFKTTFTPTGPSQLNRTGFFREEHQRAKHPKPEK